VRRIVEHALAAKEHRPEVTGYTDDFEPITKPGKPAVMLVHDQGVYLMSNGSPRDLRGEGSERSFVAYAAGCNPERDADWYDTARNLVGGDDFVDTLPWAEAIKARIDAGAGIVCIEFSEAQVELV